MEKEQLIKKTEDFVRKAFEESGIQKTIIIGMVRHLEQTRKYVIKIANFKKDTTALEIAALLHGIERAFIKKREKYKKLGKTHEERSAAVAEIFLKKNKADKKLIKKVKNLIMLHEKGGTRESDALKDADIISFLENTLPIWYEARVWMGESKKEIIKNSKQKIDRIYKNLTFKKSKTLAEPYYRKWRKWLEKREEAL